MRRYRSRRADRIAVGDLGATHSSRMSSFARRSPAIVDLEINTRRELKYLRNMQPNLTNILQDKEFQLLLKDGRWKSDQRKINLELEMREIDPQDEQFLVA